METQSRIHHSKLGNGLIEEISRLEEAILRGVPFDCWGITPGIESVAPRFDAWEVPPTPDDRAEDRPAAG